MSVLSPTRAATRKAGFAAAIALAALTSVPAAVAGAQSNAPANVTVTLSTSGASYFATECTAGGTGYCAYNDYGQGNEGALANSGTFTFVGGSFTAASYSNTTAPTSIRFSGKDVDGASYESVCGISVGSYTDCTFGFSTVQLIKLVIVPLGGTDLYGNGGGYFVARTLTFGESATATTAPEPATFALLGVGIAGLGAVVRRRRRTAI